MMQLVTTHKNTDFDALATAICATLLYPGAVPVLPKTINANVRAFLAIHKDVFETRTWDEIDPESVKRLIITDANAWNRLGRIRSLQPRKDLEIILWDHHMEGGDIEADWRCQEPTGAAITLMVRALKENAVQLTPIQATLFLAGLYEDTGSLMFPATTPEDAYAAAWLLENGADLKIVGTLLRPAYGEKQKDVLFKMLENADRKRINGYSISINKLPVKGHVGGLSLVVNMYRQILNVDAAFGIFTTPEERCMVIGRSDNVGLDMGAVMRGLGGGGHPGAGSAMLKSVNPDAVEGMIEDLLFGNGGASVQISDLMSFPVFTVDAGTPMDKVAHLLREKGCTGLPVVEGERLVGIVSRRDFKKIRKKKGERSPVKAFMSRDVLTIEPGKSPLAAARIMVKHDIGRLPVVEEEKIIGIVTRSDVMTYFYDLLPA